MFLLSRSPLFESLFKAYFCLWNRPWTLQFTVTSHFLNVIKSYGQCYSFGNAHIQLFLPYIVNSCIISFGVYLASLLDCKFLVGRGHLLHFKKWPTVHNTVLGDIEGTNYLQKYTRLSRRCHIFRWQHSLWVTVPYTSMPNITTFKGETSSIGCSKILRNYKLSLKFLNPLLKY